MCVDLRVCEPEIGSQRATSRFTRMQTLEPANGFAGCGLAAGIPGFDSKDAAIAGFSAPPSCCRDTATCCGATRRHGMKSRCSQRGSHLDVALTAGSASVGAGSVLYRPGRLADGCIRQHRRVRFRGCPRPKFVTICDRIEDHCHLLNSKPYAPDHVSSHAGQGSVKRLWHGCAASRAYYDELST